MAISAASGLRRSVRVFAPHGILAAAAGLELVFDQARTRTESSVWIVPAAGVALAALLYLWRYQDELRLGPVLLIAIGFHLGLIGAHEVLGVVGDQDVHSVYPVYGEELAHRHNYPEAEYPVGAVLLFGLEWLISRGPAETANRLLMVPFQLVSVLAVWALRTPTSRWLAAVVAIWPMNSFYWEYRFDLVPAASIVLGLLFAYRGRWGWSGIALALGASVKWSPLLSFVVLGVWLLASGHWGNARRLAGAFLGSAILLNLPFYLWAPHNFLAAYRNQGSRGITNESVWFFPLKLLRQTHRQPENGVWAPSGAPHAADLAVVSIQIVVLGCILALAWSARHRMRPALALAALAPATFLLTNRIFSPQFLLVLTAAWAFSSALVAKDRSEQLQLGLLLMAATFANAFVYPYGLPGEVASWRPFSAFMFAVSLVTTGLIVRRALATEVAAPAAESVGTTVFGEERRELRESVAALRERPPLTRPPPWLDRIGRWYAVALAAAFLVPALFVASVMPYRFWDSLAFGSWSRVFAATGDFHLDAIDINLHRPLFYVAQGLAWRTFGYHESLGRLLSLAFSIGFLVFVWVLAGRFGRTHFERVLLRGFAAAAVLASSVFGTFVAAGMADVPVAASASASALALWSFRVGRARPALVAVAAAATLLAKPTGLLALAGLALGAIVMAGRGGDRRRSIEGLAGLALGTGVALVYDALQARHLRESLYAFLRAGNADYWTARGSAARWDATLRAEWLGAGVRLVILFGLVYAVARVAGARSRLGLGVAGPVAIVWSIVGPILADGGTPSPFNGLGLGLIAYLLVAGSLLAAPLAAASDPLDRRVYAVLLLWVAPGAFAWVAYRADEVRFLSPTWHGFALLGAAGLTTVALALARIAPAAVLAPIAGVALLALGNVTSIDGLGREGWRGLLELGPSGWTSKAAIENYAFGTFSYELDFARENVGPAGRIVSNDGRLTYYFPTRVEVSYPTSCSALEGARYFALLESGESLDFARLSGSTTNPLSWLQCRKPRLQLIGQQQGIFASFVIGRPPLRPPTLSDCRLTEMPGQLYDAVFVDGVGYAAARSVATRASKVFQHVRVEQTACSTFRVVITGLQATAAGQADFKHEAESTGFHVKFVPAVRYPEVAADAPAVR